MQQAFHARSRPFDHERDQEGRQGEITGLVDTVTSKENVSRAAIAQGGLSKR
jgi:hypothetical protein